MQSFPILFYFIYAMLNIVSSKLGFIFSVLKNSYILFNQHYQSIVILIFLLFCYWALLLAYQIIVFYKLSILSFSKYFIIFEFGNMIEYIMFSRSFYIMYANGGCVSFFKLSDMNVCWNFAFTSNYLCLFV